MTLKKDTELKIRKLLSLLESPLYVAKIFIEGKGWKESDGYRDTIECMRLREEIIKEMGLLEDKQEGKLKQSKIKFKDNERY